jgi:hypothetical protein
MPPAPSINRPTMNLEMIEAFLATYDREIPFVDYNGNTADWPSWFSRHLTWYTDTVVRKYLPSYELEIWADWTISP